MDKDIFSVECWDDFKQDYGLRRSIVAAIHAKYPHLLGSELWLYYSTVTNSWCASTKEVVWTGSHWKFKNLYASGQAHQLKLKGIHIRLEGPLPPYAGEFKICLTDGSVSQPRDWWDHMSLKELHCANKRS